MAGWVLAVTAAVAACGGSSDDDSASAGKGGSSGSGGSSGGTTSTGGTSVTQSSGGSSGTKSSGGSSGSTSSGGSSGSTSSGGSSGSTSSGGSSGSGTVIMGGNCPAFSACGGDVVGTWNLTTICGSSSSGLDMGMPGSDCVKLNGDPTFSSTSSYDFKSDGTFSSSGNIVFSVDGSYDDACAMTTAMTDAATLCATFTQEASFLAQTGITISCAMKGAVCDCKEGATIPLDETGTYTISGTSITLTPDASTDGSTTSTPLDGTSDFCVDGNTINVQGSDGTITTLTKK